VKDKNKTKVQLIDELAEMRQRVAVLEAPEVEPTQSEKSGWLLDKSYERLFQLLPVGVTVLDMKGVILYCNPAVYSQGGYAEGEFTGKHFSKISSIRLKDIPKFVRLFNSVVRGKTPEPFEAIYQRNDGTTGWTELHIGLEIIGGKRRILVIQHDITERKLVDERLQQSEENYRDIVELAPDGIVTVSITWISHIKLGA